MSWRRAWSVFWYVSRWPHLARMLAILAFGLFIAAGSIYTLMRPTLPDTPDRLDFEQVLGLVRTSSPRHITFDAELDFSKKIYWTGSVPYWGNCPPEEIHPLPPRGAAQDDFRALVGCRVRIEGSIDPSTVYRLTRQVTGTDKAVREEQINLARVRGTDERVVVRSGVFKAGDAREKQWLSRTEWTGVFATYERAMKGLPADFPRNILVSARSISQSFILQDESDRPYDPGTLRHFSSHYWVPVKGSGNSIFVRLPQGSDAEFAGSISGVLEPRERSDYKTVSKGYVDFSAVTGEILASRYAVIQYRTAREYNDAEITVGWPMLLFGLMFAGAGLFGLALYIAAPGLIFDAWHRAIVSVREQWKKR